MIVKKSKIREWCLTSDLCLDVLGKGLKMPARVRCPQCKRRFKPFARECDDAGCFHMWMPKHKGK